MVNFNANFIEHYSELTAELRNLTREKVKWEWKRRHQIAFDRIKNSLCQEALLNYFNPDWDTEIICDGSPVGVSGTLIQINPKTREKKVVAYTSRKLTDPETRYGQIEREALAIYFACLKLQTYLLGKPFTVVTDHQPLVHMFNKPKAQMPFRVERIRLKLQGFDFIVKYIQGKKNPSDYMSRSSLPMEKEDKKASAELEKYVHFIIREGMSNAVTLQEIRNEMANERNMVHLYKSIQRGYLDCKTYPELGCYKNVFKEMTFVDGIILKGHKVLVPTKLRRRVITAGHDGHQGLEKTKAILRSKVWYPGMDEHVKSLIKGCRPCQASVNETYKEPLAMSELPSSPWEAVITDFYGPLKSGVYFLLMIREIQ